jgi:hypothetical protein
MKIFRFSNSKEKNDLKESVKHIKCFSSQFLENEISTLKKEIERKNSFFEFYNDRTKKIRVKIDSKLKNYLGNSSINNTKNTISSDLKKPSLNNTPLNFMKNKLKLSCNEMCHSNREENIKTHIKNEDKKILLENSIKVIENDPLSNRAKSSYQSLNIKQSKKSIVEAVHKDINENGHLSKRNLIQLTQNNTRKRKFSINLVGRTSSELKDIEVNMVSSISSTDKKIKSERKYDEKNRTIKLNNQFLRVESLYNKIFDRNLADNLGLDLGSNKSKIPLENEELNHKLYRIKYSTYYLKSIVDYSYSSLMSEKIKIINECLKKLKLDKERRSKSKESSVIDKKDTSSKPENTKFYRKNNKSLTISKFPSTRKLTNISISRKFTRTIINNDQFKINNNNQSNSSNKKLVPVIKDFNLISNRTQV